MTGARVSPSRVGFSAAVDRAPAGVAHVPALRVQGQWARHRWARFQGGGARWSPCPSWA